MEATAAARLAASLRAAMKDQALRGPAVADRVERLTGQRKSPVWVSRRLNGRKRLITVDPDLFVIARSLEVDRDALIAMVVAAVFGYAGDDGEQYEVRPEQAHKHVPEHDEPCGYELTDLGKQVTDDLVD